MQTQTPPDTSIITYAVREKPTVTEFIDVLQRSTLGERRPLDDLARMTAMVVHGNLFVTARDEQGLLIGVARALSDFSFCTYLADLAVDQAYQSQGIGQELIRLCQEAAGEKNHFLLMAAPGAASYYPHIGFEKIDRAWGRNTSGVPV